jgi:protease-4
MNEQAPTSPAHEGGARPGPSSPMGWEREALEKLLAESLRERRARRRWGIFFRLLGFAYLAVILWWLIDLGGVTETKTRGPHTAVIAIEGTIGPSARANADHTIEALRAAFKDKGTRGIVLRINSPGGSPVQAGLIYDEIRRLRAEHKDIAVYAVIEELGASAAYYVAAAADKVYVNRASLVGSIGVLIDGFGFTGAMEKLGIERRLLTAGANKGLLDPFSPMSDAQRAHAQAMLDDIHRQFIAAVKGGRGDSLKESNELFSGLIWTGAQSIKLGLADDFGSVQSVAREVVKAPELIDYTRRENILDRVARRVGAEFGAALRASLTDAPAWR